MRPVFFFAALVLAAPAFAQTTAPAACSPAIQGQAVRHEGHFRSDAYDKAKRYTVFRLAPADKAEDADLTFLKRSLPKRNAEIVEINWRTEAELNAALSAHGFTATIKPGNQIELKGRSFVAYTTATPAWIVADEANVTSFCWGADCLERMKAYFRLTSVD